MKNKNIFNTLNTFSKIITIAMLIFFICIFIGDQVLKNHFLQYHKYRTSYSFLSIHLFLNPGLFFWPIDKKYGLYFLIGTSIILLFLLFIIISAIFWFKWSIEYIIYTAGIFLGLLSNVIDKMHTANYSTIDWLFISSKLYFNLSDLLIIVSLLLLILSYIINFLISPRLDLYDG